MSTSGLELRAHCWPEERDEAAQKATLRLPDPKPHLYLFVMIAWLGSLGWFHPRLWSLLGLAHSGLSWAALLFFISFAELAWLYAFYNVGVVVFAWIYRLRHRPRCSAPADLPPRPPAVAILYTTCNDFLERSAASCVAQDYPDFTVYLLDDSSDPAHQKRVDAFAAEHPGRVRVVRRPDRRGFKAGNLNHGLAMAATAEPLFALADADEILAPDFLRRMVPLLLADDRRGFVQANHECNPDAPGSLGAAMGVGINIHWRWYQPLRNRYGFPMLLGHGALLRRSCWQAVGGFPALVSEDLAFALRIRERGWRGHFAEEVVCYEDFPETIRAFRIRHMKWTRGTCEFLHKEMWRLIRSRAVSLVEKLDILFPTANLPLSLFYFLFIIDANLVLAMLFSRPHALTIALGPLEFVLPVRIFDASFGIISGPDFFLITALTLLAPVLCFVIELARTPRQMLAFLCRSTALYGALGPLSCLGVLFYVATGKAVFHVTADRSTGAYEKARAAGLAPFRRFLIGMQRLLFGSHPDQWTVQGFELCCGIVFSLMSLAFAQVSFFGLALAFLLLPVMHHVSWDHPVVRRLIWVPFPLILAGLLLGGLPLLGIQPVLFGFGFHF